MALLRRARDGRWFNLGARTLVGRYPNCELRLRDPLVSGHHATLRFDGEHWTIQPQATRNGTFCDGLRLEPAARYPMVVGQQFAFGTTNQAWCVVDLGAPTAVLSSDDGSAVPVGPYGWTSDDGQTTVEHTAGGWLVHASGKSRTIRNGEELIADGRSWMLSIPATLRDRLDSTVTAEAAAIRLALASSDDGERIHRCTLWLGREQRALSVRRHTHLLLELAEARAAEPDGGWIAASSVCRRLGLSRHQLAVYSHRATRQLIEAGLPPDQVVIEKRGERGRRELRLSMAATLDSLRAGDRITPR